MYTKPTFFASILILGSLIFVSAQTADAQTFSGQASAVRATVTVPLAPVVTAAVNDTGPLPTAGGSINLASASATVPNIISIGASTASTSGNGLTSQSTSSVANLDTAIGGFNSALRVTADLVSSSTDCACPTATCSGNSVITNLRIGGSLISFTGNPNQTVVVSAGTVVLTVIINEQFMSGGSRTNNALHIILRDSLTGVATDIVVASSHSDITCLIASLDDRYSGRATGVRLQANTLLVPSSVSTIVSDTGFLPTSGGNIFVATAGVSLPGVLTTGVVTASTSGGLPGGSAETSQSNSSVSSINLNLLAGVNLSATLVESSSSCSCFSPANGNCVGTSRVVGLVVTVAGVPLSIKVTGAANQEIIIPGIGRIILNEQIPPSPSAGHITVNAIHVILNVPSVASSDLIIAQSHSDLQCGLAPTAGGVAITGRALDGRGRGIANVRLTATAADGTATSVSTNLLGYFSFNDMPVGQSYVLSATHRTYTFESQVIMLDDELNGLEFIPN